MSTMGRGLLLIAASTLAGCIYIDGPKEHETSSWTVADAVTHLEVDNEVGRIILQEASGTEIDVRVESEWRRNAPEVDWDVSGKTLWIEGRCPGSGSCSADITIDIPALDSITLITDVGDMRSDSLVAETIEASTDVGDIDLHLNKTPALIDATAEVGGIFLEVPGGAYDLDLDADVGRAKVSGDVEQSANAASSVFAKTDVGDIEIFGY